MRIALDAMGGDYAPAEIVKGALLAAKEYNQEIVLVGDKSAIEEQLSGDFADGLITVEHAPEVIEMGEHPAAAIRRKRSSSIVVANALVKQGAAAAVISAGNTGAAMAASLFGLGRIEGIDRPAISTVVPTLKGLMVLVDAGANVDCKPHHLKQFALMGSIYAEKVLNIPNPRVKLINIGSEEGKGNELTQTVYRMLKEMDNINFAGNIEGRELLHGDTDVAVCDGFVGNVVLKTVEGAAAAMVRMVKEGLNSSASNIAPESLNEAFLGITRRMDYSEYGGAPLLGVNGVSIISHGSSKARAIKNAVCVAKESVENGLVAAIKDSIIEVSKEATV